MFPALDALMELEVAQHVGADSCECSPHAQRRTPTGEHHIASELLEHTDRANPLLAHSPLAKGVLAGSYEPGHVFAADDERAHMARFQGDEFSRLVALTAPLSRRAEERGHTLLEFAIAWGCRTRQ